MANNGNIVSPEVIEADVALVGAGIMSATLAWLLSELDPGLKIVLLEKEAGPATESSNPWNNAGTGHAGFCELNYSVEQPDGSVDVSKAVKINEQFQVSRQLWAYLVEHGVIADPKTFINSTPHMTFVYGENNVAYSRTRFAALSQNTLFGSMEYSEDRAQIEAWSPLLIEGREAGEPIAATFDPTGTDVNFGTLTKAYLKALQEKGGQVFYNLEVTDIKRGTNEAWFLRGKHTGGGKGKIVKAKKVFIGAGGYALHLLQKAGLPEVVGYGLFPISGQFLTTSNPAVVKRHHTKVYGKAAVGAPPMSVPHLDARVIDGEDYVLFGPFAGSSPKFLKEGSIFDLPGALRPHNILPMLEVAKDNLDLVKYLMQQIVLPPNKQLVELQAFYPEAELADWKMLTAGQRAQIIKRDAEGHGTLQFGTETIVGGEGTISGLLGASPGASTAVPIMLELLKKCFADQLDAWSGKLKEIIPTWGTELNKNPELAKETLTRTANVLQITPPTN
jgi:malate dehydrogenase (quinone)